MTTVDVLPQPGHIVGMTGDGVNDGHLTIFLTRTRGPFWSIGTAPILLLAVLGTQAVATLIAVYGLFMHPLGWRWAAFVWATPSPGPATLGATTTLAAFYTDTDPGDTVYHDNDGCLYSIEIKEDHNDHPGTRGRRRCTWCTEHDRSSQPAPH